MESGHAEIIKVPKSVRGRINNKAQQLAEFGQRTKGFKGRSYTAEDVALMMVLMKISRNTQGKKNNLDNFIDMCGYAAIAGEINDTGSF